MDGEMCVEAIGESGGVFLKLISVEAIDEYGSHWRVMGCEWGEDLRSESLVYLN